MGKALAIVLRHAQREVLEKRRGTHPDPRVRRRAAIVLMSDDACLVSEICRALGVTRATVANTRRRWLAGGLESLADRTRPGRPPVADGEYLAALLGAVNTSPSDFGYAFGLWTTGRLAEHLRRTRGRRLSPDRVGQHLRAMGYVWARPKHTLRGRRDEVAHDHAHHELVRLKKGRNAETRPTSSSASTRRGSTFTRTWLGRGVAEEPS